MKGNFPKKPGMILAVVVALIVAGILIIPGMASGQPVLSISAIFPADMVQIRVDNMPANVEFAVTMGLPGSKGLGGLVAHVTSGVGGTQWYWVETHANVRDAALIEVRIDSGTGLYAYATFGNLLPMVMTPVPTATVIPMATVAPASAVGGALASPTIRLLRVQQGGWVQVQLNRLPTNAEMAVSFGPAGSMGIGGKLMAHMSTGTLGSWSPIFEIPLTYHDLTKIDLRVEGGGVVYVLTFDNIDK